MGCSNMHCLCGEHFCFTCGQTNDDDTLRSKPDVAERCSLCTQRSQWARNPTRPPAMQHFVVDFDVFDLWDEREWQAEQATREDRRQGHTDGVRDPTDADADADAAAAIGPRRRLTREAADRVRLQLERRELQLQRLGEQTRQMREQASQMRESSRTSARMLSRAREAGAMLVAMRRGREEVVDASLATRQGGAAVVRGEPVEMVVPVLDEMVMLELDEALTPQPLAAVTSFSAEASWRDNLELIRESLADTR
jgi:hypothetical protein